MFAYWGRRGLSRFALEVARSAFRNPGLDAVVSVSRNNEQFTDFLALDGRVLPITTFSADYGAVAGAWRAPLLQRRMVEQLTHSKCDVVIDLMPHVWSLALVSACNATKVPYAVIAHDADLHPGDHRSASTRWLTSRTLARADRVLTLSGAVAGRLEGSGKVPSKRISVLFHPDLYFGGRAAIPAPKPGEPLRLIFLGRIMHYKGLSMFLDMVDLLRASGVAVEIGVFGEGNLGVNEQRLADLGAEVVNRWLTEAEIGALLERHHAVVLSHIEASQSGVAATAFGAGLPVIATPVGGLVEQVRDGIDGVLARRADAAGLAEATMRLLGDPQLYASIRRRLGERGVEHSFDRFVDQCVVQALQRVE